MNTTDLDTKELERRVKKLEGEALDLAVAEALGWPLNRKDSNSDEYYYTSEDGSIIWANTWHPTRKSRQFLKLMLDYRVGVIFNKTTKKWKAFGFVDQSAFNTTEESTAAYGKTPSDALCRFIILIRAKGGKPFLTNNEERLHSYSE